MECSWAPSISAAWAGGVAGVEVIDRLLPTVWAALAPGGSFYLLLEALNNPAAVAEAFEAAGFVATVSTHPPNLAASR